MIIDSIARLAVASVSGPFVVVTTLLLAFIATRVSRVAIRHTIRQLARRSLTGSRSGATGAGLWRTRSLRTGVESGEISEQRRRQRIDAASRMVSHLASVLIWIVAAIVMFHLLEVDPAFFLSSAGFIGAGLAIGGQHKVNDYLTGLSVHFEDRYGVGDEVVAEVGWPEPVHGVVDHVGLFSTRIRDREGTMHFANHALVNVRNLSQEAPASTLRIDVPAGADPGDAADLLRGLAGTEGLTDVVFVGDLAVHAMHDGATGIDVQTIRALDDRSRERLVRRVEQRIRH